MYLAGLQKTSLMDYPDRICSIVFVFGCNFHCGFCHNPELVKPELKPPQISEGDFFAFLEKRKNVLEAVTITGGEPMLYNDLPEFVEKIKKMEFLVKLDTNGVNPEMLDKLISDKLVDYIAMDIKAPLEKYDKITGAKVDVEKIKQSIKLIMESDIDYEFRSTILPVLHTKEDVINMAKMIKGAKKYYLQKFVNQGKLLDERLAGENAFNDKEMGEMRVECEKWVEECEVR